MTKFKVLNARKSSKVFHIVCAFLLGIVISQLFSSPLFTLEKREIIDAKSYFLVILVLTSPGNIDRRNAMRETWLSLRPKDFNNSLYQIEVPLANETDPVAMQKRNLKNFERWLPTSKKSREILLNFKIKTLFAVGLEGLAKVQRQNLESEQQVYNDMLLLDNFHDSYANLTLKLVKSMKKITEIVPNFKFLLKSDDDTYVKLDLLLVDLIEYHKKASSELYWGYFNGKANIKTSGAWKESTYNLCDHYLPYALGGGYVLSSNLIKFVANYSEALSLYKSEDVSMGTWLSPFRNIHKRHDVRFDTAYMARSCRDYHLVMHKKTAEEMRGIYSGQWKCGDDGAKRPIEYFYDWTQTPRKCCS